MVVENPASFKVALFRPQLWSCTLEFQPATLSSAIALQQINKTQFLIWGRNRGYPPFLALDPNHSFECKASKAIDKEGHCFNWKHLECAAAPARLPCRIKILGAVIYACLKEIQQMHIYHYTRGLGTEFLHDVYP